MLERVLAQPPVEALERVLVLAHALPRFSGLLHFWEIHHAPQNVHFATSRSGAFCVRLISKMAQTRVY